MTGTDTEPSSITVGLVAADTDWALGQARGLPRADSRIETHGPLDHAAALDGLADFDCVVVDRETDTTTVESIYYGIEETDAAVAVVLAIGSDATPSSLGRGPDRPTAVYRKASGAPHPAGLARRIVSAVEGVRSRPATDWTTGQLRTLLDDLSIPVALADSSGDVTRTSPAFKATFGMAERLPSGLPTDADALPATVECDTLAGPRSFRYTTVSVGEGCVCHVLRDRHGPDVSADGDDPPEADRESTNRTDVDLDALTDRQREVLRTAFAGGFFERPKTNNSDELAAELDITRSTFLQHLRAAQRKLLAAVFD